MYETDDSRLFVEDECELSRPTPEAQAGEDRRPERTWRRDHTSRLEAFVRDDGAFRVVRPCPEDERWVVLGQSAKSPLDEVWWEPVAVTATLWQAFAFVPKQASGPNASPPLSRGNG